MKLSDRIVILTGATGGIGVEICKNLLNNNYTIIAPIRNITKGKQVFEELSKLYPAKNIEDKIIFFYCDLLAMESINNCISIIKNKLKEDKKNLSAIIHNAGIIANQYVITEDGYESTIQTNYISGKTIIDELIPYLCKGGKIINTLSLTAKYGAKLNNTFNRLNYYSHSKYLLYCYTKEIAIQHKDLIICMADPGIVDTGIITMNKWFDPLANIFFRPFIKSPKKGATPIINAINFISQLENTNLYLFKSNKIIPVE